MDSYLCENEYDFGNGIIVTNIEGIEKYVRSRSGNPGITFDDIQMFISTEKNTIYYGDRNGKFSKTCNDSCKIAWLDTGLTDAANGKPLFISLIKNCGEYRGYFCKTPGELIRALIDHEVLYTSVKDKEISDFYTMYNADVNERTQKHLATASKSEDKTEAAPKGPTFKGIDEDAIINDSTTKVVEIAHMISDICMINPFITKKGLHRFIILAGTRLVQLIEEEASEYYIANAKQYAIINTGLLDKFGNDIYLLYYKNNAKGTYYPKKVLTARKDWVENDFTKEQSLIHLSPISFGDTTFNATISDFDISIHNLEHIFNAKDTRVPDSCKNISAFELATRVNDAIKYGMAMQERDHAYIKASYSGQTMALSWLMPLHLSSGIFSKPELVLVIAKRGDFYEAVTVLPYDDEIKDRITALSLYSHVW